MPARLFSVLFSLIVVPYALAQTIRFEPPVTRHPDSRTPVALSIGDFEGDGFRDLAVAYANGTTTILRNQSIGVAGPRIESIDVSPVVSPAGSGVTIFADLDGDHDDEWISNAVANHLLIVGGTSYPALPRAPRVLRTADLDGDGNLDLIAGYSQPNGVASVLRGRGDGGVNAAMDVIAGGGPALAIVDWNGDGALDLVAGSPISPRITVAHGSGALTFGVPQTIAQIDDVPAAAVEGLAATPAAHGEPASLAFSLAENASSHLVYVMSADGLPPALIASGPGVFHATFADISGDGAADLIIVDTSSRGALIYKGGAGGSWPLLGELDVTAVAAVVAGDVSGDGLADLVVASPTGEVSVYVNTTTKVKPRRRAVRH